ncbi:hypothetical protein GGQ97_002298 [Sphingomonas kaistensis]|uniref:DUF5658 domain-containing protein n=1 Tax=Sphingomonas kaistensis TaxID=298708 RepID=A0A7X5Y9P4_9SPHN|nr:DUF5658 family protein [Sphingomonas kaistensis]NJC06505.1 hypothetical protein [Sphingomonas kaistensis]
MNIALVAAIVLAVLQLLDLWSTHLFRSVGITEANPIFGPTFNKRPFWLAAVLKPLVSAVLIVAAWLAEDTISRAVLAITATLVAGYYLDIVIGNFRAWRRRKGQSGGGRAA